MLVAERHKRVPDLAVAGGKVDDVQGRSGRHASAAELGEDLVQRRCLKADHGVHGKQQPFKRPAVPLDHPLRCDRAEILGLFRQAIRPDIECGVIQKADILEHREPFLIQRCALREHDQVRAEAAALELFRYAQGDLLDAAMAQDRQDKGDVTPIVFEQREERPALQNGARYVPGPCTWRDRSHFDDGKPGVRQLPCAVQGFEEIEIAIKNLGTARLTQ